ncbi:MAG: adenylyltransferase/cytidyltransferase family protein [Candidatus Nanoarchaeia archaeon]
MKVVVSGGFDPIHVGHLRMFNEAKQLAIEKGGPPDIKLVVLLNNDNWLKAKKGYFFMPAEERAEILRSISYVDDVVITDHTPNPKDTSVCKEIQSVRPDFFANGGDRQSDNTPEVALCNAMDVTLLWNVGGGKIRSSSEIVDRVRHK